VYWYFLSNCSDSSCLSLGFAPGYTQTHTHTHIHTQRHRHTQECTLTCGCHEVWAVAADRHKVRHDSVCGVLRTTGTEEVCDRVSYDLCFILFTSPFKIDAICSSKTRKCWPAYWGFTDLFNAEYALNHGARSWSTHHLQESNNATQERVS